MQRILLFLLLLPFISHAQGWQWGRGNTGGGVDSWPVATDPSGNVFVAGFNFSAKDNLGTGQPAIFGSYTVPFYADTTYGMQSIIAKYDAGGNFLWAIGTQNGSTWPINIATDKFGNSYLFGTLISRSAEIGPDTLINNIFPESQYFLAKINPAGKVLWAVNAGNSQNYYGLYVGAQYVLGTGGIATDTMNNIYITTNFHLPAIRIGPYTLTNADLSGNTDDILVAKYDSLGNVVWVASSGGKDFDDAYSLTVTPAGNIYIGGVYSSRSITFGTSTLTTISDTSGNAFIAEYNSYGAPLWASSSGGRGGETAVGMASDASDNIYLTGGLSDTSITFSGTTITNPYPGNYVLYLVKFAPSHNVSWYKTIGGPNSGGAWGYSIAMSSCGAIWVSGAFHDVYDTTGEDIGEVNIDGNILRVPSGSKDPVFIAGFNTAGSYVGSAALQSGADDQNGIACDAMGNVYICSDYACAPFIVGNDTIASLNASGFENEWQYVAKYTFVSSPDTFFTHEDTTVCTFAGIVLNAPQGYSHYLWENGNTSTSLPINAPGTYWVVGSGVCTIFDSITVAENESLCGCNVFLPNAFTPNHDGKDDDFKPLFISGCPINNYSFAIYNRWGQQVFYSDDQTGKWDGTFRGGKQDMGVYMYYLKYTSGLNNTIHTLKGDVTLIR